MVLYLTRPQGEWFDLLIDVPAKILAIIVIALVVRWFAHRFIRRLVDRAAKGVVPQVLSRTKLGEAITDLTPGTAERRAQRARTMGSLLRSVVSIVVLSIAFVMILEVLGLPIAPLLTGAGIAGVALGFGAQTLVKDFLSGIFMILEDQYGVGDVVDLGEAVGTVEAVGLRVTRLRDVNGTAWYVRNGEILRVGNMSKSWSRVVLDITVGFDSDLDQVQEILEDEAKSLAAEPEMAEVIIAEPEVWGVERFDAQGVVVRTVLMTAPARQTEVARALRSRIQRRFKSAGIQMPTSNFPQPRGQQQ